MISAQPNEGGYLDKRAAAAYLSLSPRTLDYAVERGELVAFRLTLTGTASRKVLFRRTDLDAWYRAIPDNARAEPTCR
jgi:excisionase family DNA binding protein